MALAAAPIRDAIRDVLQAHSGTYTGTLAGKFLYGAWEQQPEDQRSALLVQRGAAHYFDVDLGPLRSHEASNQSNRSDRRIAELEVTVRCYSRLETHAQPHERSLQLASIWSDLEDAAQALATPGNLSATAASVSTNIVGGLMRAEGNAGVPEVTTVEVWEKRHVRSEIKGSVIVTIARSEA